MAQYQTFTQYFKLQALRDRLPFNIDFEMKPVHGEITESVAGFDFTILEDLTSRESWFFDSIEALSRPAAQEATLQLRSLATKLKVALNLDSMSEAINILWNGSEEYVEKPEYVSFFEQNNEEITNLLSLLKLSQDTHALNWLRVTFFILSRTDRQDWCLGDTTNLSMKQIDSIVELIVREANGGVNPNSEDTTEDSTEVVDETEGKSTEE